MADIAQVDRIISEVNDLDERTKIQLFQKIEEMYKNYDEQQSDEISLESVFGLWKDRNITKDILRKKAWKNN